MRALIVIVWTIVGLVVGAVVLSAGIDAREGKAGMFAVFFGAPVGAVAGFALGLGFANRFSDNRRIQLRLLGAPIGAVLTIVLGAYLFETYRTWDDIDDWGGTYSLSFQVRLREGVPSPAGEKAGVALFSDKENPECDIYDYPHGLTREGDRFLISGQCVLRYATAKRTIGVKMSGGPTHYFKVRVGARPESRTFSEWFPTDEIKDTTPGAKMRPPRPEEVIEIRYGAR